MKNSRGLVYVIFLTICSIFTGCDKTESIKESKIDIQKKYQTQEELMQNVIKTVNNIELGVSNRDGDNFEEEFGTSAIIRIVYKHDDIETYIMPLIEENLLDKFLITNDEDELLILEKTDQLTEKDVNQYKLSQNLPKLFDSTNELTESLDVNELNAIFGNEYEIYVDGNILIIEEEANLDPRPIKYIDDNDGFAASKISRLITKIRGKHWLNNQGLSLTYLDEFLLAVDNCPASAEGALLFGFKIFLDMSCISKNFIDSVLGVDIGTDVANEIVEDLMLGGLIERLDDIEAYQSAGNVIYDLDVVEEDLMLLDSAGELTIIFSGNTITVPSFDFETAIAPTSGWISCESFIFLPQVEWPSIERACVDGFFFSWTINGIFIIMGPFDMTVRLPAGTVADFDASWCSGWAANYAAHIISSRIAGGMMSTIGIQRRFMPLMEQAMNRDIISWPSCDPIDNANIIDVNPVGECYEPTFYPFYPQWVAICGL